MKIKPLGIKSYGSIAHLPNSRLGPGDHKLNPGQAAIALGEKVRHRDDIIIVQEKLDGSNVGVAKLIDGRIVPLTRSGYVAETSSYLQHHLFSDWVYANYSRFDALLEPGERICGEWLAQAHGTLYELLHEPFVAFDIFTSTNKRLNHATFTERVQNDNSFFITPNVVSINDFDPLLKRNKNIDLAFVLKQLKPYYHGAIDPIEGAVWRVENKNGEVDFLCKYVRPNKVDGIYILDSEGKQLPPTWNINLKNFLPEKALKRLGY